MGTIIAILFTAWIVSIAIRTANERRIRRQFRENDTRWERQYTWNAEQEAINRKQAEKNEKFEAQLRKQKYLLAQATSDIDNLAWKIEEAQKYSEYLETERSKCAPGGKEYFKWQNKLSTNDDKIYRLTKAMNKAQFVKAEAELKLREVA